MLGFTFIYGKNSNRDTFTDNTVDTFRDNTVDTFRDKG